MGGDFKVCKHLQRHYATIPSWRVCKMDLYLVDLLNNFVSVDEVGIFKSRSSNPTSGSYTGWSSSEGPLRLWRSDTRCKTRRARVLYLSLLSSVFPVFPSWPGVSVWKVVKKWQDVLCRVKIQTGLYFTLRTLRLLKFLRPRSSWFTRRLLPNFHGKPTRHFSDNYTKRFRQS